MMEVSVEVGRSAMFSVDLSCYKGQLVQSTRPLGADDVTQECPMITFFDTRIENGCRDRVVDKSDKFPISNGKNLKVDRIIDYVLAENNKYPLIYFN